MYSKKIITKKLNAIQDLISLRPKDQVFSLKHYSIEESQHYTAHLLNLINPDYLKTLNKNNGLIPKEEMFLRPLLQDELNFIENERILCQNDFLYCATHYFLIESVGITSELSKAELFNPWVSQKMLLSTVAMMEEMLIAIIIQILKARQLGACLDPNTKVLTADLDWIPIDQVQPGQELVAVDEGATLEDQRARYVMYQRARKEGKPIHKGKYKNKERKLRKATVLARHDVYKQVFRLTMENGQELLATREHRFLSRQRGSSEPTWRTVETMRVGDVIRHFVEPWDSGESKEDGWFSGLLDGEGSLRPKDKGGVEACVSQVEGAVLDRAIKYLSDRGYTFRYEVDNRKGGESSKFGNKPVIKLTLNRIAEVFRLIGQTKPSRFMDKIWWEGKGLPSNGVKPSWYKITKIEILPEQRMVDLQTTEKTYIADGFVSHNSTAVMLIICHRILFQTFVKALVGSSDPDKTSEMTDKIRFVINHLPPWLRPIIKMSESPKEEIWIDIPSLNNRIIRQHGTALSGMGRGNTPTIGHLSEIPDFSDPDEDIDASLIPAMHENPNCFLALESTAKGDVGYWPKTWRYNVQNWPKGEADMFPLFFPWNVGIDIYPTRTWERKHPIPQDWTPAKETIAHKKRCEDYAQHDPLLKKFLGKDYRLPKRQMYFYEMKRKQATAKGNLSKFLEEHPATPDEAFQVSGRSIFSLEQIEEMKNRAKPLALYKEKPAVFALIGTDISSEYEPDLRDIDTDRPPIEITSDLMNGENKATYRLLPLNYETSMMSPLGLGYEKRIFIWEFPFTYTDEVGNTFRRPFSQEYGLGNDNAEGIGENCTAINIIRKGSIYEYSEQVCEFATKWISANELVPWIDALGSFYSHRDEEVTNECKLVVEIACGGSGLQHRLRVDRGWFNFHRWEGAMDTPKRKKVKDAKLGWETNRWTRPWIVGDVARDIKDGYFCINSPFLIRECQTLQKEDDESKIEAKGDDTDDRFFSSGMAHFSLSIWDIRKRIDSKYSTPLAPTLNDTITKELIKEGSQIGKVKEYLWPEMD